MKRTVIPFLLLTALCATLTWTACNDDDPPGPNDLGGDPNLELTQVGQEFPLSISSPGSASSMLNDVKDSIVIIANDGGIVTMRAIFKFDSAWVHGLEEELGMAALPMSAKRAVLTAYLEHYGATMDTTDKTAMSARLDMKFRITSEGMQEFISSGGDLAKPFTIVKYNANVGDTWEFTDSKGVKITRTVTYKSTTDDYPVGFWNLKVIKIEETKEDPLLGKITYVTNHKYGLVGVLMETTTGKTVNVTVYPPTL